MALGLQAGLEWRGVAARELHHSEGVYLRRLTAVVKVPPPPSLAPVNRPDPLESGRFLWFLQVYLEPLMAALNTGRTILSSNDLRTILVPVTSILELNR